MNIVSTQFFLSKNALEIYISGCKEPHCKGCSNPELWEFNQGKSYKKAISRITEKIRNNNIIKSVFIVGGEPLDNDIKELEDFIKLLSDTQCKIWLFTRYSIDKVPDNIKKLCSYIKCGKYDVDKLSNNYIQYGVKLASTNQKIYKV